MRELIEKIEKWADDRGILRESTIGDQQDKLDEEVAELWTAIVDGDGERIVDGIGDCAVVLIVMAKLHGIPFEKCLSHAWNEIKDRTGKMVDGVFVKDA